MYQKDSNELSKILQEVLKWNKARINFMSMFILSLIKVCTVNLVKISAGLSGEVKLDSNYRRAQRFFQNLKSNIQI